MKRDSFLVSAALGLLASMLVTGPAAEAAGPREAAAVGGPIISGPTPVAPLTVRRVQDAIAPHGFFALPSGRQHVLTQDIVPHGFFALPTAHGGRPHRRRGPRRSIVTGGFAPPVMIAAPPAEAYGPEDYADASGYDGVSVTPPAAYPPAAYPPVAYTEPVNTPVPAPPAPPPAPTPNAVQYDTGRYELRGDGMTTPYTWVWIPNPPPPPPAGPPGPRFADDPPGRPSQLYRWTDEQGVVHLTDRLDSVPRPYRVQAKQTPPS